MGVVYIDARGRSWWRSPGGSRPGKALLGLLLGKDFVLQRRGDSCRWRRWAGERQQPRRRGEAEEADLEDGTSEAGFRATCIGTTSDSWNQHLWTKSPNLLSEQALGELFMPGLTVHILS